MSPPFRQFFPQGSISGGLVLLPQDALIPPAKLASSPSTHACRVGRPHHVIPAKGSSTHSCSRPAAEPLKPSGVVRSSVAHAAYRSRSCCQQDAPLSAPPPPISLELGVMRAFGLRGHLGIGLSRGLFVLRSWGLWRGACQ